jgi:hypothetical protein
MGIHRGDRFTRLVSMSSRQAGLSEYRDTQLPQDDPRRAETFSCGDINSSLLQTAHGRTLLLQYDIVSPRPYTRGTLLQGSKGAFRDFPAGVWLEGESEHDWWQPLDALKTEFEHPLWKRFGEQARQTSGHGGMDYIMSWRLAQCLREGLPPDMDVYDAAAWSAPGPLSELSVAQGSAPVEFPDFTRGRWQ